MGDDDQNIYAFSGSSVEFIRRFETDYQAKTTYLTHNYRSTHHIITAANKMIKPARQRMKIGHSITINRARAKEPHGAVWSQRDPLTKGRTQILPAGKNPISQAQTAVMELQRLADLTPNWDWSTCAVVAREWKYLDPVRSLCEMLNIPAEMANEDFSGFWHLRETQALRNWLGQEHPNSIRSTHLKDWLEDQPANTWNQLLQEAAAQYKMETGDSETPSDYFIEWLAEWGHDFRRQQRGLLLTTAHRAKGLEFDHVFVLDGSWERVGKEEDADAPRRLYYVAMTRARQTLTLMRLPGPQPLQDALQHSPSILHRHPPVELPPPPPELHRRYRKLSLADVHLSYAGRNPPGHPIHQAIASPRARRPSPCPARTKELGNTKSERRGTRTTSQQIRNPHRHALRKCLSLRYCHMDPRVFGPAVPPPPPLPHLGSRCPRTCIRTEKEAIVTTFRQGKRTPFGKGRREVECSGLKKRPPSSSKPSTDIKTRPPRVRSRASNQRTCAEDIRIRPRTSWRRRELLVVAHASSGR